MKSKRVFGIIVITFFMIGIIAVTDAVQAETNVTKITFWYTENDTEKPGVIALVDEFEAQNPDIDVEALQKGFFDARSLYINNFIAGTEPDVFRATRDWIPEFAAGGMLSPLTDEFNQTDLEDFLPAALNMVTYPDEDNQDQLWAFPQTVDTTALMYNKHYFSEAGIDVNALSYNTSWTWAEYLANCELLGDSTAVEYATILAGMFTGAHPYYYGNGARLFEGGIVDVDHIGINSSKSRFALQLLKQVVDADYTPIWEQQGWTNLNPYFAEDGIAAMISQGPWELKNFLDNSPEFNPDVEGAKTYAEDNLGIMQLPHDAEGNQGAPVGMHGYVISAFTTGDKYEASVKLSRFLSSAHAQAEAAIDYYHVPCRQSVMNRTDVQNAASFKYVQTYYEAVLNAIQVPVSHNWASLEGDFADNIDEYLADDITLNEMIKQTLNLWRETLGQAVQPGTSTPTGTETGTDTGTDTGTETETSESSYSEPEITPSPGFTVPLLFITLPVVYLVYRRKKYRLE